MLRIRDVHPESRILVLGSGFIDSRSGSNILG
jgi:hypothetical protein